MDTLETQITAFLITILAGLTIGILFDVYRVIRSSLRPGRFLTTAMDIVFWLVVTPIIIIELVVANWLELRFYVLLGGTLGLFLYFSVLSPFFLAALLTGVEVVAGIFRGLAFGLGLVISAPVRLLQSLRFRYRLSRRFPQNNGWVPSLGRWRPVPFGRTFRR